MKRITFITGTRADYGKLKPLINGCVNLYPNIETHIFVSGMHLLEKFGNTYKWIIADGYKNVFLQKTLADSIFMDDNFTITVNDLAQYVKENKPDMIIVHGDRIDALAGAIVAMLNNICLGHIEGGEVTGTVDESIRHSVSKMANLHFVSNQESKIRLIQLGEEEKDIYVIGSPDIDIMLSEDLPNIDDVKTELKIDYKKYGILMYHPVTTELNRIHNDIHNVVEAIMASQHNYIVIYPNNDAGSDIIIEEYKKYIDSNKLMFFKSIRFERFLTLLKNSEFIIGNSSAGVREACVYGVPAIDIGMRQKNRYSPIILQNIIHVDAISSSILRAISKINSYRVKSSYFGSGNSADLFTSILQKSDVWDKTTQKVFKDTKDTKDAIQIYHNEVCF